MNKTKNEIFAPWEDLLADLIQQGKSAAVGIFSLEGELLFANSALCFFLDTNEAELKPKNAFINPDINYLLNKKENGLIFQGLLTLGDSSERSYVLDSKIFRNQNQLFLFAEANVPDLFEQNKKMSHLNQEVNNLQRQLIKEKKSLQITLNELKETQQMLIHSEKMNALGKLVAGVAHEVNNPIAFIYSNLYSLKNFSIDLINSYQQLEELALNYGDIGLKELINDLHQKADIDYLSEDMVDIINESMKGVERIKVIVEDLRKFSRLDESDLKRINLVENIKSTLSFVKIELTKKNINFALSAPPKLEIDCYPGQLNQALLNILINSIQAVSEKGEIEFSIEEKENSVYIIIRDNGCGIPQEVIKKVFDPFFTTKPIGQGTGLGLSITYKIISDLHKGFIDIISEKDKGTSVIIRIPNSINI